MLSAKTEGSGTRIAANERGLRSRRMLIAGRRPETLVVTPSVSWGEVLIQGLAFGDFFFLASWGALIGSYFSVSRASSSRNGISFFRCCSHRQLTDLGSSLSYSFLFWLGSVTDHSTHTPLLLPFQYLKFLYPSWPPPIRAYPHLPPSYIQYQQLSLIFTATIVSPLYPRRFFITNVIYK